MSQNERSGGSKMTVQELARKMAERLPAVALIDCPNHEGHEDECYARGHSDGWMEGIGWVYHLLCEGKFDNFYEFYEHYTEGQVAT